MTWVKSMAAGAHTSDSWKLFTTIPEFEPSMVPAKVSKFYVFVTKDNAIAENVADLLNHSWQQWWMVCWWQRNANDGDTITLKHTCSNQSAWYIPAISQRCHTLFGSTIPWVLTSTDIIASGPVHSRANSNLWILEWGRFWQPNSPALALLVINNG